MDINGAKALKKRLGPNGESDAPSAADSEIPVDAPPVYRWIGKKPPETVPVELEDESEPRSASLFSRLSLSFR